MVHEQITNQISICEGESYLEGNQEYTQNGVYEVMYESQFGCDSLVITELEVMLHVETSANHELCHGDEYTEGSSIYTESGLYEDLYTSFNGCDSLVTTELTFYPNKYTTNQITMCPGEEYLEGNSTYLVSGEYSDLYTTSNGCDSLVTTELVVLEEYETLVNEEICTGDFYLEGSSVYSETGTYENNYTSVLGCDSSVITELTLLPVHETPFQVEICSGETYVFNDSILSLAGTYQKNLTNSFGCDSTLVLYLIVHENPDPLVVLNSTENCTPCALETSVLNINDSDNVLVNFGEGETYSANYSTHSYSESGIYQVTAEVTDENGCVGSDSGWLECFQTPDITIDALIREGCEPLEVQFSSDTGSSSIISYQWFIDSEPSSNEMNPLELFSTDGNFDISLSVTDGNGCMNFLNEEDYIQVYPLPEAGFSFYFDGPETTGNPIDLVDESFGNVVEWQWNFEGDYYLEPAFGSNPEFNVPIESSGNYIVYQTVITDEGCRDSIKSNLTLESIESFYIPNAFTPDGDGINEFLEPVFLNYRDENFLFTIYNRWGLVVFQTEDINEFWNGRAFNEGDLSPNGVYSYLIQATSVSGKREQIVGHVSLLN